MTRPGKYRPSMAARVTARGCTDHRGGPESARRAHAPGGGGRWRSSIPPEALYPDAASTLFKRPDLAQPKFNIGARIANAVLVSITGLGLFAAFFLLLFVRLP
jgi:hypothetical protein